MGRPRLTIDFDRYTTERNREETRNGDGSLLII